MTRFRSRMCRGLTLVELLVVLAIISLLIALLLPAIQAAREAARQVQCRNHLHQQVIACLNYESIFRRLPGHGDEGGVAFMDSKLFPYFEPRQSATWMVQIMPNIEQQQLFQRYMKICLSNTIVLDEETTSTLKSPISIFYCPSRRDAAAYPLVGRNKEVFGELASRTDYAMCAGAAEPQYEGASVLNHLELGVWATGIKTKLIDITDGLSNTYMLGEKAMDISKRTTGNCVGDLSPLVARGDWANSYVRLAARGAISDKKGSCLVCHDFGSAHTNGWNGALCDGSVHCFSYYTDLKIHRRKASINGDDIVSEDM